MIRIGINLVWSVHTQLCYPHGICTIRRLLEYTCCKHYLCWRIYLTAATLTCIRSGAPIQPDYTPVAWLRIITLVVPGIREREVKAKNQLTGMCARASGGRSNLQSK